MPSGTGGERTGARILDRLNAIQVARLRALLAAVVVMSMVVMRIMVAVMMMMMAMAIMITLRHNLSSLHAGQRQAVISARCLPTEVADSRLPSCLVEVRSPLRVRACFQLLSPIDAESFLER